MAGKAKIGIGGIVLRVIAASAVGVVCALMPFFLNDAIGYAPLFCYAILLVLAFAYVRMASRMLDFDQSLNNRECTRGKEVRFELKFKNNAPFALFRLELEFQVDDGADGDVSIFSTRTILGPREDRLLGVDIKFDHVGVYQVGLNRVRVYDFLGLFSHTATVDGRCRMRVLPRIYPIDRLPLNQVALVENRKSIKSVLSDNMDYAYVREYELGDPMKTVHWKLSARTEDQLFTKLFEAQTSPGISVLLDLRCLSVDDEDKLLDIHDTLMESAYSVLDYTRQTGVDATFTFRDKSGDIKTMGNISPGALNKALEQMPRLGANGAADSASEMLERYSLDPSSQSNLILFTAELSDETTQEIVQLGLRKKSIAVFFAIAPNLTEGERRAAARPTSVLARAGVPVFVLSRGSEVGEIQ